MCIRCGLRLCLPFEINAVHRSTSYSVFTKTSLSRFRSWNLRICVRYNSWDSDVETRVFLCLKPGKGSVSLDNTHSRPPNNQIAMDLWLPCAVCSARPSVNAFLLGELYYCSHHNVISFKCSVICSSGFFILHVRCENIPKPNRFRVDLFWEVGR